MRALETIASVTTADGRSLSLHRRETDFFIHLDGEELMSSRRHGSEAALAELTLADLSTRRSPRVLIGGLGLGFTLQAALATLPQGARVVVAEIFAEVVAWNRSHLSELGAPLSDPRVSVVEQDVVSVLRDTRWGAWDAILLDVDNGPSAWCLGSNAGLYDRPGLEQIRGSLAADGVLGVWSAYPDPAFVKRLRKSGFDSRCVMARAHQGKGSRSFVFLGRV